MILMGRIFILFILLLNFFIHPNNLFSKLLKTTYSSIAGLKVEGVYFGGMTFFLTDIFLQLKNLLREKSELQKKPAKLDKLEKKFKKMKVTIAFNTYGDIDNVRRSFDLLNLEEKINIIYAWSSTLAESASEYEKLLLIYPNQIKTFELILNLPYIMKQAKIAGLSSVQLDTLIEQLFDFISLFSFFMNEIQYEKGRIQEEIHQIEERISNRKKAIGLLISLTLTFPIQISLLSKSNVIKKTVTDMLSPGSFLLGISSIALITYLHEKFPSLKAKFQEKFLQKKPSSEKKSSPTSVDLPQSSQLIKISK